MLQKLHLLIEGYLQVVTTFVVVDGMFLFLLVWRVGGTLMVAASKVIR